MELKKGRTTAQSQRLLRSHAKTSVSNLLWLRTLFITMLFYRTRPLAHVTQSLTATPQIIDLDNRNCQLNGVDMVWYVCTIAILATVNSTLK